jgi:hypothetical protein
MFEVGQPQCGNPLMEEVCRCKDTTQKKNGSKKRRKSKPRSRRSGDTNGWLRCVKGKRTSLLSVSLGRQERKETFKTDRAKGQPKMARLGFLFLLDLAAVRVDLRDWDSGGEGEKEAENGEGGGGAATGLDLGVGRCQGKLARENWKVWSGRRSERERRERERLGVGGRKSKLT